MKVPVTGFFTVLLAISPWWLGAQEFNKVIMDSKAGKEVMVGYLTRDGLKGEVFGTYYEEEYRSYEPVSKIVETLRRLPDAWEVTIVLGTWCSDSQREVPRFLRIMDEAGIKDSRITLIGVDRKKEARGLDLEDLEIELVPTFIFYRDGKEMGRIIETPKENLETDMLVILARPPAPPPPGTR
ncbi:MAG: thioredoxin family protein, partial [Bacteroidales bacterium]|nr:thioredoxin family protein [Bacteroidales bacterium]